MNQTILKTEGLVKRYGKTTVLHHVSIELKAGRLYGLIGQNGAGKTTLMRLITGLGFADEGRIELFGENDQKALRKQRGRVGSMIERPCLIPYMTAQENMRYHRLAKGIPNPETEAEALAVVGLADTGSKKAGRFSLGMRQRLSIAAAILGKPDLLILDEPINGLDPSGVVEIRSLLKKLCAEQRMTILLSSHNLPELYQTVTDYIMIHEGSIKRFMTHEELDDKCGTYLSLSSLDNEKLVVVLETQLQTKNFKVLPDGTVRLYDFTQESEWVGEVLFQNGIALTRLAVEGDTLEDYFLTVIGGGTDD